MGQIISLANTLGTRFCLQLDGSVRPGAFEQALLYPFVKKEQKPRTVNLMTIRDCLIFYFYIQIRN